MTERPVALTDLAQRRAAHLGEAGRAWVQELPQLLAGLQRRWGLDLGEPLPGGSTAYVARARTADGTGAVLKVVMPGEAFDEQVRTLTAAAGRGYARLLASDPERRALLLEPLGPSLDDLGLAPEAQIDVLSATLRRAWQPAPEGTTLDQARSKAVGLAELVMRLGTDLRRPCPEAVVAEALRFADRRAAATDLARVVVVHGDPHPGNALTVPAPRVGAESGFVLVDPDGFVADPAYDAGVVLRDWCDQLLAGDAAALARRYCRLVADGTGLDEVAVWEWGYLERVSTGLHLLERRAEDAGRPFLLTAERLLGAGPPR